MFDGLEIQITEFFIFLKLIYNLRFNTIKIAIISPLKFLQNLIQDKKPKIC